MSLKKNIIKENANFILKNNDKYFFIIISNGKPKIISFSKSKSDAKETAIDFLTSKLDKIKNVLDKIQLYRITLKKVSKEEKEEHKKSEVDIIGGTLVIILEEINITISQNNKLKLIVNNSISNRNKIFIDNKYLKKYNQVSESILKKISFKYSTNNIRGGFTINRLSAFL